MRRLHLFPKSSEVGYLVSSGMPIKTRSLPVSDGGRDGHEAIMRDRDASSVMAYAAANPDRLEVRLNVPVTADELATWIERRRWDGQGDEVTAGQSADPCHSLTTAIERLVTELRDDGCRDPYAESLTLGCVLADLCTLAGITPPMDAIAIIADGQPNDARDSKAR